MSNFEIIRAAQLAKALSVTEKTVWVWAKNGTLPAPIRISDNTVGWRADVIQQWLDSRPTYKAAPNVTPKRASA